MGPNKKEPKKNHDALTEFKILSGQRTGLSEGMGPSGSEVSALI
jgi:hypothetical protein